MDTALADPLVGTVLDGRYRVEALLAYGGMSSVYAGTDQRLGRPVAIKVMAAGLVRDPVFVERFGHEARAAALLSHPNVAAVHDQGMSRSATGLLAFLVMELVPGCTLRDLLRERHRLAPAEALSILEPVLAGLAAAHRAGVVHRDVKPENVLISTDGVVKVAAFGLARASAAPSTSTRPGLLMGTVAYVAPELVSTGVADTRTDVYAAGIMLFELLTGSPPYVGDAAVAIAYRHVHDNVPAPSTVVPGVPPAVDALVLHATRRDPAQRPANAAVFLAELLHARADAGLARVTIGVRVATPAAIRNQPTTVVRPGGPKSGWPAGQRTAALPVPPGRPAGASGPGSQRGRRGTGRRPADPWSGVDEVARSRTGSSRAAGRWPDERRAHRRRFVVGMLCVLLLAAGAGVSAWWYGSGRMVDVPRMVGTTQQQAAAAARSSSLTVKVGAPESSKRYRAGLVIRTEPGAGDRVLRGTIVTLTVSSGPPLVAVPDVVGRSQADAEKALHRAGLTASTSTEFSDEVADGTVIRQSPRGRSVQPGSTVAIVVSNGPQLVTVPDVRGQSATDAKAILAGQGFVVKTRGIPWISFGQVFQQSPGAGHLAPRGSTVTLYAF